MLIKNDGNHRVSLVNLKSLDFITQESFDLQSREVQDYRPILDYEYRDISGESFDKMTVADVLKEMNEMSRLRSVK